MNILLIGFGSIGKRHYEVLSELSIVKNIDCVTKQNIPNIRCYKKIHNVENIDQYDYFIIASETNKHFEQLTFLDDNVKNKIIFCEKPLFEEKKEINIKENIIFLGYVLRFHPLLAKLKCLLEKEHVIALNAKCGQYLPYWRPKIDYTKSYSSKKEKGGGVLLDLSHEIDYTQWLCGKIYEIKSCQSKISDLKISSDDFTMFIGKTDSGVMINISLDYISKKTHRKLQVETLENTFELDFIENQLLKKNKDGIEEIYRISNVERNYMFERMHLDIFHEQKNICTFEEGLNVMDTISVIQEQNR